MLAPVLLLGTTPALASTFVRVNFSKDYLLHESVIELGLSPARTSSCVMIASCRSQF